MQILVRLELIGRRELKRAKKKAKNLLKREHRRRDRARALSDTVLLCSDGNAAAPIVQRTRSKRNWMTTAGDRNRRSTCDTLKRPGGCLYACPPTGVPALAALLSNAHSPPPPVFWVRGADCDAGSVFVDLAVTMAIVWFRESQGTCGSMNPHAPTQGSRRRAYRMTETPNTNGTRKNRVSWPFSAGGRAFPKNRSADGTDAVELRSPDLDSNLGKSGQ